MAVLIGVVSAATVGGAWAIQLAGYPPCELCLKERIPYYVAVLVAAMTSLAAWRGHRNAAMAGFAVLILCFMTGAALGLYHTGVEWKVWSGPTECSGVTASPPDVADFLKQLEHVPVVRCDEAALHVFGLSLAFWNALICLGLIGLANLGLLRSGLHRPNA